MVKFFFVLFSFVMISCASNKEAVSETDVKRLLEKVAQIRIHHRINLEEGMLPKSDREIFLEVCGIFRLDPEKAIVQIESLYPELYPILKGAK